MSVKSPPETPLGTVAVAVAVCLVCAICVCAAAVFLKQYQDKNSLLDKQRNILAAAGLLEQGIPIQEQFKKVVPRIVNLNTGAYDNDRSPDSYNPLRAAKTPDDRLSLSFNKLGIKDNIKIGRRENFAIVYLVKKDGSLNKIILPIRGYGLWSTLYGFIALEADGNTIAGLGFYNHKETPGLGGEVDNPNWKSQWAGKKLYSDTINREGKLLIEVLKGKGNSKHQKAQYQIDGLSGATLTSKGVSNLIRFWMGSQGFGPYLAKIQSGEI